MKRTPLFLIIALLPFFFSASASAAAASPSSPTTKDLRIRFGSTTGITELEDDGFVYSLEDDGGSNFQIDFVVGLYRTSSVGLVLSAGLFSREHSGFDIDPFFPTRIDL